MTKYAVPHEMFYKHAYEEPEWYGLPDQREHKDALLYFNSEMAITIRLYLEYTCEFYFENNVWYFDGETLDAVRALTVLIDREYEAQAKPIICEAFNIGGDDSVEYNSNFVEVIVQICERWIEKRKDLCNV